MSAASASAKWTTVPSAQSKYERKQIQPKFFIPEKSSFHKPEKIPPLIGQKRRIIKKQNKTNVVDYKNKVNEYHKDIAVLEKTGKLPENKLLEADLQKMNSEEIIEVVDTKETPQNEVSAEFNEILKKTLENN